jgi:Transposase, Mutator family
VRGTVEETLNALLDAEADRLCNAQRYERSAARRDTRAGHYERSLETKIGEVRLRVPKLPRQTFETAIIERYRRRESSVRRGGKRGFELERFPFVLPQANAAGPSSSSSMNNTPAASKARRTAKSPSVSSARVPASIRSRPRASFGNRRVRATGACGLIGRYETKREIEPRSLTKPGVHRQE